MNFLAPGLLFGAAAIAVPIILHFFYKARYKKLPWAAMRFLKLSIEQTSKRLRYQEYILLALRCLVLLLLALALARPTMKSVVAGGRGESIDAVLVIDVSMSMAAKDGEMNRLDRAKAAALSIIDNLPANSTVHIITVADRAVHLGPASPRNFDQARYLIKALEPTSLATDFLPAFNEAAATLERSAGTHKEVYIFTDLQKTGFDKQIVALKAKAEQILPQATLLFVRCAQLQREINSVAVTDISLPQTIPYTGARLPFTVHVRNSGKEVVKNVSVTLEVDGRPLDKETQQLPEVPPQETITVSLSAKFEVPGMRVLTARVQADDQPGDDKLDRIINVRETIRVVLVDGRPDVRDSRDSATHFVRNAILHVTSSQVEDYFIKVNTVTPDEANPAILANANVCILADVPATSGDRPGIPGLSADFIDRLKTFVKDGGGLIIGAGENLTPASYNVVFASLLPFPLAERPLPPIDKPLKFSPDSAAAFMAGVRLNDELSAVTTDVEIGKSLGMKEDATQKATRVVMRYADQTAAIASRTVGEGEVVMVATSLDTRWTNWPARPGSYVTALKMAMAHLTSLGARGQNRIAGETLVWTPPESKKGFEVELPNSKRAKLGKALPLPGSTRPGVTYTDTTKAGVYTLANEGDVKATLAPAAVSPDFSETDDPTCLTDTEVEQRLGFRPVFLNAGSGAETDLKTERDKREWTVWVLLALFVMACLESAWAWVCGKAWV